MVTANQPHLIPNDEDNEPATNRNQTQHRYNLRSNAHVILHANAVINKSTGKPEGYTPLLRRKDSATWIQAYANDLDRLAQGRPSPPPTPYYLFAKTKYQQTGKSLVEKKSARYVQTRPKLTVSASPLAATNYPTLETPPHPAPAS